MLGRGLTGRLLGCLLLFTLALRTRVNDLAIVVDRDQEVLPVQLAWILVGKVDFTDVVDHGAEEAGVLPLLLGVDFKSYLFVSLLGLPGFLDLLLLSARCTERAILLAIAVPSRGSLVPATLAHRFLSVDVIDSIDRISHLLLEFDLQRFGSLLLVHLLLKLVLLLLELVLRLVEPLEEAINIGGEIQFFANKVAAHGTDQVLVVLVHFLLPSRR